MFTLGLKSEIRLNQVHPKLVNCVREAILDTTQDFMVNEGVRSIEQELKNIQAGTSHLKDPHNCQHCIQASGYGQAVDLVPFVDGKASWDWDHVWPIVKAMQIAEAKRGITIRWGGVWDRTLNELGEDLHAEVEAYKARRKALGKKAFLDGVHFEIVLGE